jgi:hypothetical protein
MSPSPNDANGVGVHSSMVYLTTSDIKTEKIGDGEIYLLTIH